MRPFSYLHYWKPGLCRVFLHSAKSRQSPLGNIFVGKGTLPSAFYRGTRQNILKFYRVPGKALDKIFASSRHLLLTVTLPSGRPALGNFFYFFTLPSAPSTALGKVFFFFL
jgi:hypothetical protein